MQQKPEYGNYTFLCRGDHLPTVGVLQKLLRRAGFDLDPDGVFGPNTFAAVQHYQRAKGLRPIDGIVGPVTWARLTQSQRLPILDSVDIFDSFQLEEAKRQEEELRRAGKRKEAEKKAKEADEIADSRTTVAKLEAIGSTPIVVPGMSGGVERAVSMICGAAGVDPAVSISANPASATQGVFLLRFFGHGNTGQMGVSSGRLYPAPTDHDGINPESIEGLRPILAPLSAIFGPYGSCELKGCNTGRGAGGQKMLAMLASIIGVPVTAALKEQEDERDTVSFYGPTKTAIPSLNGSKMTLKQWCHNLPDFPRKGNRLPPY